MRFEFTSQGERSEFWVFDTDSSLEAALERLGRPLTPGDLDLIVSGRTRSARAACWRTG